MIKLKSVSILWGKFQWGKDKLSNIDSKWKFYKKKIIAIGEILIKLLI